MEKPIKQFNKTQHFKIHQDESIIRGSQWNDWGESWMRMIALYK